MRLLLSLLLFFGNLLATAQAPNIVLIITDDQGYGDLGITGNHIINTPNIDALARQSAHMRQYYVSPVCSPTRASLMTGRYNYRTGVVDTYIGRSMMHPEELTVAEILKKRGYQNGIFGKWHLGDCYPMRPLDQGFDVSLVHFGGGLAQPSDLLENQRRYTDVTLFKNGQPTPTKGYCTDVYFDEALAFMQANVQQKKPFFAYIATNTPHDPYDVVPKDLYEKYLQKDIASLLPESDRQNKNRTDVVARVFAMIENIDQNVAKLTQKLTEWGIKENTIVIFMTDNGPNTRRYVGNMRGMKGEVHEGGIRTSFFWHWPSQVRAGTVSDRPVAHIDILPTLLEATQTMLPQKHLIDGRSFWPLLKNPQATWPARTLYLQWHRGDQPKPFQNFAARAERYKLLSTNGQDFELYDLQKDPTEQNNLIASFPEEAERMKKAYLRWLSNVSNTRPNNYSKPRIVLGSAQENTTRLSKQDWQMTHGTGWGERGYWRVKSLQPSSYQAEVILQNPLEGHALELTAFGHTWRGVLSQDGKRGFIGKMDFPIGETDLEVTLSKEDKQQGPYQVILKRVQ